MDGAAARHEAEKVLAELPDRISDVIKPFARRSPDHPALVQGDVTWTYAELAARVADTVAILKLYEIRPGDRVMIVSENSLALVALILAASEIDAWSVVVNPRLSAREVDLIREHSGARRVFYTIEVSDAARQHAERHDADIAVLRGLGTLGVGPLNRDTVPEPVEVDRTRQVAALVYTSGTTGNPKGVMLTHRNLLFSARITSAQRDPTDKAYCVLPISHIVGYSGILVASLMVGATVQLVPRYDPAALVSAMVNDGITMIFGVPTTYQRLLEYKAVAGIETLPRGKLRRLAVAGRAARRGAEIQDRGGIRAAVAQRLRHYRMCTRYRGRPGGDAEKRRRRGVADHRDRGAPGETRRRRRRSGRDRRATRPRSQRHARILPGSRGDRGGDRRQWLV